MAMLAVPTTITPDEVHPLVGASMIAQSRSPSPKIDRIAPTGSGWSASGFFDVGTTTTAPTNAITTIGTLTKKMEPHQKLESNSPPAIGPMAMPSPMVPPHTPMARALSFGSRNTSLTIDREDGIVNAAPTPITDRNTIKTSTEPENAAPIEPPAKTASPMRKNRLRPNRSAKLPPTSNSPAKTIA